MHTSKRDETEHRSIEQEAGVRTGVELLVLVRLDDVFAQLLDHRLELVLFVFISLLQIGVLAFQVGVVFRQHVDLASQIAHFFGIRTDADHGAGRTATTTATAAVASFRLSLVAEKFALQFFIQRQEISLVQSELLDSCLEVDVFVDDHSIKGVRIVVVVHMFHRNRMDGEDRVVDLVLAAIELIAQRPNFTLNENSDRGRMDCVKRLQSWRYPPMW